MCACLKITSLFSFFGLLSLIVFAVALILFIPVFIEYGRTGLVRRLPTLVTAGLMGMAALLLLVCGLILDTQGKTSRQQYELQMNAMQMLYDLGRQERQGEAGGQKRHDTEKQTPAEREKRDSVRADGAGRLRGDFLSAAAQALVCRDFREPGCGFSALAESDGGAQSERSSAAARSVWL